MFERYLKKPMNSSVGFLVLDKMISTSSRQVREQRKNSNIPPQERGSSSKDINSKKKVTRNNSSNNRYDMFSHGGGVISDAGKSPNHSLKDQDGGESFAVSILQTTFEVDPSYHDKLRPKKFDTLSTDPASLDRNSNKAFGSAIQSATISMKPETEASK